MCRGSGGGRFSVSLRRVKRKIHLFHFFLFRLRLWQCLTGLADKRRQIIAVVHVFDEEIVFRAVVRWTHFNAAQQRTASVGRFYVEAIVADEAEDDAVAVDAVVTEHLFHGNLACTSTLVGDVLNEVGVACHGEVFFVIAQKYEKIRKPRLCLNCGIFLCLFCFYCFDIQLFVFLLQSIQFLLLLYLAAEFFLGGQIEFILAGKQLFIAI